MISLIVFFILITIGASLVIACEEEEWGWVWLLVLVLVVIAASFRVQHIGEVYDTQEDQHMSSPNSNDDQK